jgi:hypothetical protein
MLLLIIIALLTGSVDAAVRMPAFFGDGMVMQTNGEYGARVSLVQSFPSTFINSILT